MEDEYLKKLMELYKSVHLSDDVIAALIHNKDNSTKY